jgi:hypothetical protein
MTYRADHAELGVGHVRSVSSGIDDDRDVDIGEWAAATLTETDAGRFAVGCMAVGQGMPSGAEPLRHRGGRAWTLFRDHFSRSA